MKKFAFLSIIALFPVIWGQTSVSGDNCLDKDKVIAYPNPVSLSSSVSTTIQFELCEDEVLTAKVFDVSYNMVRVFFTNEYYVAGVTSFTWDCRNGRGELVNPGVYYIVVSILDGKTGIVKVVVRWN
jgi:flagellar hook assembly protein FlgD